MPSATLSRSARWEVAQRGRVRSKFISSRRVADNLYWHGAGRQRALDLQSPAATSEEGLKLPKLSAPSGFDVAIACCVARHLRTSEANRSHLEAIGLRPSREVAP